MPPSEEIGPRWGSSLVLGLWIGAHVLQKKDVLHELLSLDRSDLRNRSKKG